MPQSEAANQRLFIQELVLATMQDDFLASTGSALNEPVVFDIMPLCDISCNASPDFSNMSISSPSDEKCQEKDLT